MPKVISRVDLFVRFDFDAWMQDVVEPPTVQTLLVAPAGSKLNDLALMPEQMLVVGGEAGSGKTALVQQLMFDALRQEGQQELHALVCNVEMSPAALVDRELARISGVPYSRIRLRSYINDDLDRVQAVAGDMCGTMQRVRFMGPPFTTGRLQAAASDWRADLVVVDYIQRIGNASNEPRAQVSTTVQALRDIAREGRVVLAIAALNRMGYDKSASAGHFRDSSEIEYGADDAYILQRKPCAIAAPLKCLKRRFGEPHDIELRFDGDSQLFSVPGEDSQ